MEKRSVYGIVQTNIRFKRSGPEKIGTAETERVALSSKYAFAL
jgi:hypothetical protein